MTRRSQEPTNKQVPIIKGVLPDAPAPAAAPRPVATAAPAPATKAAHVAAKTAKPAEKGFFAWLKALFGATEPVVAAPVRAAGTDKREGRPDGRGPRSEGQGERRDGRRNDRGPRAEGQGNGQGQDERRDGRRNDRGPRADGQGNGQANGQGQSERRDEARSDSGRGPRDGNRPNGRSPRPEARLDAEGKKIAIDNVADQANNTPANGNLDLQNKAPRQSNRPARGERRERTERPERAEGTRTEGEVNAEARSDERGERADRGGEGQARNPRNERRNDRGPRRDNNEAAANVNAAAPLADLSATADANNTPVDSAAAAPTDAAGQEGQRTERRSRDRYGRDRRERSGERTENGERVERNNDAEVQTADRGQSYFAVASGSPALNAGQMVSEQSTVTALPVIASEPAPAPQSAPTPAPVPVAVQIAAVAPIPAAPAAPTAPTAPSMPAVTTYALPTADLAVVASNSGLQWVGTDASKVAAVQASIAAELAAAPARTPRERPPAVVVESSGLVLVETKRDLRNMQLPFEKTES